MKQIHNRILIILLSLMIYISLPACTAKNEGPIPEFSKLFPDVLNLREKKYEVLQEAYNVLGENQKTAVCSAYARAFALICQYAGMNCAWV